MIRIALFALWLIAAGLGQVSAQTYQSLGSASLAVTVASGRVALPAGSSGGNITILNVGTDEAFINFGGSSVTAATTNESVPAGSGRCFAITSQTYVAAITAANTATLRISQGSGPCSLSYRGGSSTGVTAAAVLGDNQIVVGDGGARGIKTVTTGTNVLTALGNTAGGAGGFALVGSTPPTGAAGGDLASTYPNPTLAWISRSAAQTLNIGAGGTLGSNAFTSTGYMPLAGGTFTGGIGFSATNTLDIGTNATTLAPRTVYAGTSFVGPTGTFTTCVQVGGATCGGNALAVTGTANISGAVTTGTSILIGGSTSSFPAIFRSAASIQFRLADNSGDAAISASTGLFTGSITLTGTSDINSSAVRFIGWTGRSYLGSPADGTVNLGNNSGSNTTNLSVSSNNQLTFGALDAAVAVAQTTRVQSVVAGTAAANGANWTLIGSLPTGTGTSGDIIFQTGVKTGSGTTQGTATTALTIKGETQQVNFAGQINVAAMTQTSAAQSGTVCYNSGTGAINYDATLGCLTSTMTEKDGWRDLTPKQALAIVLKMQAGSFVYKKGRGLPDGEQIGLSAEQLASIDGRLVGYRPNGELAGVRYQQASALYPMAIQALWADNHNLRAEIETLKLARR